MRTHVTYDTLELSHDKTQDEPNSISGPCTAITG